MQRKYHLLNGVLSFATKKPSYLAPFLLDKECSSVQNIAFFFILDAKKNKPLGDWLGIPTPSGF